MTRTLPGTHSGYRQNGYAADDSLSHLAVDALEHARVLLERGLHLLLHGVRVLQRRADVQRCLHQHIRDEDRNRSHADEICIRARTILERFWRDSSRLALQKAARVCSSDLNAARGTNSSGSDRNAETGGTLGADRDSRAERAHQGKQWQTTRGCTENRDKGQSRGMYRGC